MIFRSRMYIIMRPKSPKCSNKIQPFHRATWTTKLRQCQCRKGPLLKRGGRGGATLSHTLSTLGCRRRELKTFGPMNSSMIDSSTWLWRLRAGMSQTQFSISPKACQEMNSRLIVKPQIALQNQFLSTQSSTEIQSKSGPKWAKGPQWSPWTSKSSETTLCTGRICRRRILSWKIRERKDWSRLRTGRRIDTNIVKRLANCRGSWGEVVARRLWRYNSALGTAGLMIGRFRNLIFYEREKNGGNEILLPNETWKVQIRDDE